MKSYLNPQPFAVDRIDKIPDQSNKPVCLEHEKELGYFIDKKSDKEIFEKESEEQAWRDVLQKDRAG